MSGVERRLGEVLNAREFLVVGKKVVRVDALDAVLGRAAYTRDLIPEKALWVKAVRSPEPHALIKEIDLSDAMRVPGVSAAYTWRDIPGVNNAGSLLPERPLLAVEKVRHYGEAVAVVAGERVEAVEEAVERVKVAYEPLPAVFDPLEAMKPEAPKISPQGNLCAHLKIRKGDVEKGFQSSEILVENTYQTEFIDAAPLEPEIGLAIPEPEGRITCIGSMQCPFDVRDRVAEVLGLPYDRVRVVQAFTGGGFGPKSDETPIDVCALAALVAYKTGKSAVMAFTRDESMVAQTKRHKFIIRNKTGASRDGRLLAWESLLISDTGAYVSKGRLVMIRAIFHCAGPYEVPNVKADGYCVLTNNTLAGSTRGFGAPQAHFAAERQMDELAHKLGMDPLELRMKNMLRPGSLTITSDKITDDGLQRCVEWVYKASRWRERRSEYQRHNKSHGNHVKKGIGVALIYHGNTLGPEGEDFAYVHLEVGRRGEVVLRTGLTDFGTGSSTSLAMVVAEELGVPLEKIRVERPDTGRVENPGPTVASRVVAIGGRAAQEAARKLREKLAAVASELLGCGPGEVVFREGWAAHGGEPGKRVRVEEVVEKAYELGMELRETGHYTAPPTNWDRETGRGKPYNQYTYGALVAEVEVDVETGVVRVRRITAAYDVGRAVNPTGLKAVIHGGTIMGLGQALLERFLHEDGVPLTTDFSTYWLPTMGEAPDEIIYELVESPGPVGVYGAKAMGEIPVVPPPAAIANAVAHALGVNVRQLPLTPDRVLELLREGSGKARPRYSSRPDTSSPWTPGGS